MDEDIGQKITDAFAKYSRSGYESTVSVLGDIIEIRGRPEGIRLQLMLLLFFIAVPVAALFEEQSVLIIVLSLIWLVFFGRIFLEITKADLYSRFNINDKTFEIENINPVVIKIRKVIRFRYSWEGLHKWSDFKQIVLREKRFGKWISNREYRLFIKNSAGKEYPIAEFTNDLLAENVAYIIARMTGTRYFKIRAR